ncbi:hypothetical protein PIB30_116490, partial [Stylosanthes scabra]|nr:hypothetical protein [Stylosanthes scabra]
MPGLGAQGHSVVARRGGARGAARVNRPSPTPRPCQDEPSLGQSAECCCPSRVRPGHPPRPRRA